jgi:hypothetical protein
MTVGCFFCGSSPGVKLRPLIHDDRIEGHHVGRAVYFRVRVPLCTHCHRRQTDLQYDAGVFRKLEGEEQPIWALIHGLAALLIEQARALGLGDLASLGERQHRGMLRLLASLTDEPLGPNPITNTLGDRGRLDQPRPVSPALSAAELLEAVAALLPVVIDAANELLPGSVELLPGFSAAELRALITPASAHRIARDLAALEDHPRAGALAAAIERAALWPELVEQLIAHAAAGEEDAQPDARLVGTLRALDADARLGLHFLLALAGGENPSPAFERFLTNIETERSAP